MELPIVVRVNGVRIRTLRIRQQLGEDNHPTGKTELVIVDPVIGAFAIDERFDVEIKDVFSPPRRAVEGWRRVTPDQLLEMLAAKFNVGGSVTG
jgi:hypothetical protein